MLRILDLDRDDRSSWNNSVAPSSSFQDLWTIYTLGCISSVVVSIYSTKDIFQRGAWSRLSDGDLILSITPYLSGPVQGANKARDMWLDQAVEDLAPLLRRYGVKAIFLSNNR